MTVALMEMPNNEMLRRAVHYLFMLATLAMLASGFGITQYQLITPLTGGLLTKTLSFQLHYALTWIFIILLALHIYLALTVRKEREKKAEKKK
jgi:thiosulfate reductase cytochrome b subunit